MERFWKNGGKLKLAISILSFAAGLLVAYTRTVVWTSNLCREVEETKRWKNEVTCRLDAIEENISKLCLVSGITPTRAYEKRVGK